MKTVQLYIVVEKSLYRKKENTRFVGLFVFNEEYLRFYSGTINGSNYINAVFLGIIKGMEMLKEKVNLQILTDDKKILDTLDKNSYLGLRQKLNKYPGKLTWELFSPSDPKGIFILNELQKGLPNIVL